MTSKLEIQYTKEFNTIDVQGEVLYEIVVDMKEAIVKDAISGDILYSAIPNRPPMNSHIISDGFNDMNMLLNPFLFLKINDNESIGSSRFIRFIDLPDITGVEATVDAYGYPLKDSPYILNSFGDTWETLMSKGTLVKRVTGQDSNQSVAPDTAVDSPYYLSSIYVRYFKKELDAKKIYDMIDDVFRMLKKQYEQYLNLSNQGGSPSEYIENNI